MTRTVLLVAVVLLTVAGGLLHRSRQGRIRDARPARGRASAAPGGRTDDLAPGGRNDDLASAEPAGDLAPGGPADDPAVGGLASELRSLGETAGERATLLQFSSAFCAPCRATRRTLEQVSAMVDGVVHVEVDAEQHLGLVRRLGILKTPTTLILDAHAREVKRASGQPRKADVLAALGHAVP